MDESEEEALDLVALEREMFLSRKRIQIAKSNLVEKHKNEK